MAKIQFVFDAIGTKWIIDIYDPLSQSEQTKLLSKVKKRIDEFDKDYSRFRSDSLITKMSKKKGKYILPPDAQPLFDLYQKLYKITKGQFTPLIGNTLEEAGYDATYSLKPKTLHKPLTWDKSIIYSYPTLTVKTPVVLDLGAAGKGYLIDIVGSLLVENNINNFCVDAGGDILYKNKNNVPLKVGLEHPENLKQVIGSINIVNGSICGSAGNRRKWGNFHHIINPKSLTSPVNILSIWVLAQNTLLADGISTSLFFTKPKTLAKHFDFEYLIMYANHHIEKSSGFAAELYYQ